MLILRRLYSRAASSCRNQGINRQHKLLQNFENEEVDDVDFDELEADFTQVHKSHKEHMREMEAIKERVKYFIVRQKYFKEKYPNFLTWHDKEQIRLLHQQDPDEWTIEKLSEGFPALPQVIKQIVKAKWTKKNTSKILSHDQTVMKNWDDYKRGKLNELPEELKEHLKKFFKRRTAYSPDNSELTVYSSSATPSRAKGEFSEIISSYERLKGINKNISVPNVIHYLPPQTVSKSKGGPSITFQELQRNMERKQLEGRELNVQEKLISKASLAKVAEPEKVELEFEDVKNIIEHKHEKNVGFVRKTKGDVAHLIYPQKIVIPKSIYKKGCTYKLNDCYYASDGEFLYRVPGMC